MINYLRKQSFSSLTLLIFFGLLVFSYVPVITLGSVSGVHIDVSLLYMLAIGFIATSVGPLRAQLGLLWSFIQMRLLVFFAAYVSLSAIWSSNPPRALLTAGFLWLMVLLASSVIVHFSYLKTNQKTVYHLLSWAFAVVFIWSVWQIIADSFGLSGLTLLSPDYTSGAFGVARPSGFALEPQFLGSLLLAPLLWSLHYLFASPRRSRWMYVGFVLLLTLLVLTISRGALLAFAVGSLIIIISSRISTRSLLRIGAPSLVSVGLAFSLQFVVATANTRDAISGIQAISSTISQFSLGTIQIDSHKNKESTARTRSAIKPASLPPKSGYVKSSTESRLSMSEHATELWRRDLSTILFGVGVGGFGTSLHQNDSTYPISSVTNNYYSEMLAETGLVGVGLFVSFVSSILVALIRKKAWLLLAIVSSFLVQWTFFSGNANVLHVWVIFGLAIAYVHQLRIKKYFSSK